MSRLRMHANSRAAAGVDPTPPPSTNAFGPSQGAQKVRDDAGPRTVTDPGSGVDDSVAKIFYFNTTASPGTALNNLIASKPIDSTFVIRANTYTLGSTAIRDQQKSPTIVCLPGVIFQGDTSFTVNSTKTGVDTSFTAPAASPDGVRYDVPGFRGTIRGGTWRYFNTAINVGAGTLIQDATVEWCWTTAFQMHDDEQKYIDHCEIRYIGNHWVQGGGNGVYRDPSNPTQIMSGWAYNPFTANGTVWSLGTEFSYLNVHDNFIRYDPRLYNNGGVIGNPLHEGGMKLVWSANDWFHHCWVHDSYGFGLWWDVYNRGDPSQTIGRMLIEECVVEYCGTYNNADVSVLGNRTSGVLNGNSVANPLFPEDLTGRTITTHSATGTIGDMDVTVTVALKNGEGHNLSIGDKVSITGASVSSFNSAVVVTAVVSTTAFTWNDKRTSGFASGSATGGSLTYGGLSGSGIYYEISYGPIEIRRNYVSHCYGGQITARGFNYSTHHDSWMYGGEVGAGDTRAPAHGDIHHNFVFAAAAGGGFGSSYNGVQFSSPPSSDGICGDAKHSGSWIGARSSGFSSNYTFHDNDITSNRQQTGFAARVQADGFNAHIPLGNYPAPGTGWVDLDNFKYTHGTGFATAHDVNYKEDLVARKIAYTNNHYHIRTNQGTSAFAVGSVRDSTDSTVYAGPQQTVTRTFAAWQSLGLDTTGTYTNFTTWREDWVSSTAYVVGDAVQYNGQTWVCLVNNTNSKPTTSNANWKGN